MTEFVASQTKIYAYLTEDDSGHKKSKGTKKCVTKRQLMFEDYKNCVINDKAILKINMSLEVIIIMYTP